MIRLSNSNVVYGEGGATIKFFFQLPNGQVECTLLPSAVLKMTGDNGNLDDCWLKIQRDYHDILTAIAERNIAKGAIGLISISLTDLEAAAVLP